MSAAPVPSLFHRLRRPLLGLAVATGAVTGVHAQAPANGRNAGGGDAEANLTAIRCELYTARLPDAVQVVYFYLSDDRRTVLQTDGNALGNVLQYNRQRVVVSKTNAEGGARTYTFDRMMGSLTVTLPAPSGAQGAGGGSSPWTMSGECQKVDASRPKF